MAVAYSDSVSVVHQMLPPFLILQNEIARCKTTFIHSDNDIHSRCDII